MGSGKSTIGPLVAERLGVPLVDVDAEIEARAGVSIAALFAHRGEAAFRAIEAEVVRELAAREGVLALGGGAVADEGTRALLLRHGVVVTLTAPLETLTARIAASGRPLERELAPLLVARAAAYAESHATLGTHDRSPAEVADAIVRIARDPPVVVALGERSYRVTIGAGVRREVAALAQGALVVTDTHVRPHWAEALAKSIGAPRIVELPAGEEHKGIASLEAIWNAALEVGIDRGATIVAVGVGVVGDVAGLAAATLLRGVRFGQVPTTLLAMVDSSVGGKTGIDRPQGKNLVGAFHQPSFVSCDIETLTTLPSAERIAGLAEVAKSAWLDGEGAVDELERDASALLAGDPEATVRAIRMAVTLKARIVGRDERESAQRMLLNLGHTIGHAIEAASGFAMRHGEAVALGLVAAFRVGRRIGTATEEDEARAIALLGALGLPTDVDRHLGEGTLAYVGADKKRAGAGVRFVLPGSPGHTRVELVPLSALGGLVGP